MEISVHNRTKQEENYTVKILGWTAFKVCGFKRMSDSAKKKKKVNELYIHKQLQ